MAKKKSTKKTRSIVELKEALWVVAMKNAGDISSAFDRYGDDEAEGLQNELKKLAAQTTVTVPAFKASLADIGKIHAEVVGSCLTKDCIASFVTALTSAAASADKKDAPAKK